MKIVQIVPIASDQTNQTLTEIQSDLNVCYPTYVITIHIKTLFEKWNQQTTNQEAILFYPSSELVVWEKFSCSISFLLNHLEI